MSTGCFQGQVTLERSAADVPDQMSRKRPASAVTCHDEGSSAVDLLEWSFSCFMLVLVDEAGSPRKVPEDLPFSSLRLGRYTPVVDQ